MLNLGLFFLHVVGANEIYTGFLLRFFPRLPLTFFDLVHWQLSFIYFLIGRRHISSLWLMPDLYNYCWRITSLESPLGKKETRIFYVASVIIFSAFLESLWKSTLLVHYKLNISRPPRVNDLIFVDCYSEFTPGSYR